MAPHLNEPIHVCKNDSFLVAFPAPKVHTTYGIDFNQVHIHELVISFLTAGRMKF